MLIIYSKPNCQACELTKSKLYEVGLTFEERNINGNKQYLDELRSYYNQDYDIGLPTVVLRGQLIASGYDESALLEVSKYV